jgi:hypothetical protein
MSAETLQGIEDALRNDFEATFEPDDRPERRGAVIIDWIAAVTISNLVELDGRQVVGFHNEYYSPDTNPNSQAHLAQWAAEEIADILHPRSDDD